MIRVCCYKGCGVIYDEIEPLSDKRETHAFCPQHFEIVLKKMKAQREELTDAKGRLRILIVEDSTPFRQLLKEILHNRFPSGETYEAIDEGEALLQVETVRPDLIFMDIRLPGENGLQLTGKIKTRYPNTTVIILTSYDSLEYREAAMRSRADCYIPKESSSNVGLEKLVKSFVG